MSIPTTAYTITEEDLLEEHVELVRAAVPDVTREQALTLIDAAEPLWDAMGALGWVDGYGGGESRRVMPDALALIRHLSNCPGCAHCTAVDELLTALRERYGGV